MQQGKGNNKPPSNRDNCKSTRQRKENVLFKD